jgi:hypothetical protein
MAAASRRRSPATFYRKYSLKLIEKLAKRYGNNPNGDRLAIGQ